MKIGIVGAGIMGRLLALACFKRGDDVTLFDQHQTFAPMNCSMAAAGMLAPVAELEKSDYVIYQLGYDALHTHWPQLLSTLNANIYFQANGCVMVSHPNDKTELTHCMSLIKDKLKGNHPELLNREQLLAIEPELEKFNSAYYLADEGHIDNQALMMALAQYLTQHIQWHENTLVLDMQAGTIKTSQGIHDFDFIFDCRGLGAKSALPHLQSVRGELIWLYAPEINIKRAIRFHHPRYKLYLVPRPNNHYLIGASEIHSDDDSPISVRSALEFLTAAYYLHPGFAEARILKTVTHCRPSFPDYLPKIKATERMLAINGLYRHGFLIAPALAADILRWLQHGISALQYPGIWELT